jgi:hypothetical protein
VCQLKVLTEMFLAFLEEINATYGDLLLHSEVRWLSVEKSLEKFLALGKRIPTFLSDYIKSDTNTLEDQLRNREILKKLILL